MKFQPSLPLPLPPNLKILLFVRCAEVSERRSTSHDVSGGPDPYVSCTPPHPSAPPSSPLLQANQGVGGRGDLGHWTATADSVVSAMD